MKQTKNESSEYLAESLNKLIQSKIELYHTQRQVEFVKLAGAVISSLTKLKKCDRAKELELELALTETTKAWNEYIDFTRKYKEFDDDLSPSRLANLTSIVIEGFSEENDEASEEDEKIKATFTKLWKRQNPMLSEIQLNTKYEKSKLKIKKIVEENKIKSE